MEKFRTGRISLCYAGGLINRGLNKWHLLYQLFDFLLDFKAAFTKPRVFASINSSLSFTLVKFRLLFTNGILPIKYLRPLFTHSVNVELKFIMNEKIFSQLQYITTIIIEVPVNKLQQCLKTTFATVPSQITSFRYFFRIWDKTSSKLTRFFRTRFVTLVDKTLVKFVIA